LTWASYGLPFGFTFPTSFVALLTTLRSWASFFILVFFSSFLWEALAEDVCHVDAFFEVRGCLGSIWDFLLVFCSKFFPFALLLLPSFGFFVPTQHFQFNSAMLGVFQKLLGLSFLECPQIPLVHW